MTIIITMTTTTIERLSIFFSPCHHHHQQQHHHDDNDDVDNSNNNNKQKRPCSVERVVILLLLTLAWSWIVASVLFIFHHHSMTIQVVNNNSNNNKNIDSDKQRQHLPQSGESPLLIFTCRRAEYLRETLEDVFHYLPQEDCSIMGCPVVVSQDGTDKSVVAVIQEFQSLHPNIPIIHYQHSPPDSHLLLRKEQQPYKELAIHYKWAIAKVFREVEKAQRIIILEEDLHLAPDFFGYFAKLAPLLDTDPTVLAISAFNDNGSSQNVKNVTRVVRSDFFPGLGWMLTRRLWESELSSKWPNGYWDDWLREPQQRQGRHILRPEISRTFHFGVKGGASKNQFGSLLQSVMLNQEPVDWESVNLGSIKNAQQYHNEYMTMVHSSKKVSSIPQAMKEVKSQNVQLHYSSLKHFATLAKQLHIMQDEKAGVPRTAYHGIVEVRPRGQYLLFLVPNKETR